MTPAKIACVFFKNLVGYGYMGYGKYWKPQRRSYGNKPEYKKYRVKSSIKTFRDLEVYKNTTLLVVEIFQIKIPESARALEKEFEILKEIAKPIPKLIAESYGDKFSNIKLSLNKLERAMRRISDVIAKIDFLVVSIKEQATKETLNKILRKYQIQRIKILNLQRAWNRVFSENFNKPPIQTRATKPSTYHVVRKSKAN
ncbi:MAG: hypothetical protein KJ706_04655 [Candidatus Omnitrophica bacterium]|nr:hypothetical protein [Candidatus Omnitrophota bacterium]